MLATTNHPAKLDSSILDRPSRFDRKYYFHLPADAERLAYIEKWNGDLQAELQVSENGAARLVGATDGFSFAYLKELFIASMAQWLSERPSRSMDDILLAQTDLLREQMKIKSEERKLG